MKLEFELNKKKFEQSVIIEIARQILTDENNKTGFSTLSWDNPMRKILLDKAHKLLGSDKKFEEKLMKDIKLEMNNKRLRVGIVKEILREKLND